MNYGKPRSVSISGMPRMNVYGIQGDPYNQNPVFKHWKRHHAAVPALVSGIYSCSHSRGMREDVLGA